MAAAKPARTVLIGGASSDIGLALCRSYLAADWRVIAQFRTPRAELSALEGPAVDTWQIDFADTARIERELHERRAVLGTVDAFVNLAAAMPTCSFESATAEKIISTLSINLLPGLLIMQALAPAMVERGWGRIVHSSSIGVKFGGGTDSFLYSLSKHAQEFIPRAARLWAASGVLVNVVRVGVTATRAHDNFKSEVFDERVSLIPAQRPAMAAEIAALLFWLGSEQNGYVSGEVIGAAGGE